jgi:hypothetical protein
MRGTRPKSPAPFSVLDAHHKKNRKIQAPNPTILNHISCNHTRHQSHSHTAHHKKTSHKHHPIANTTTDNNNRETAYHENNGHDHHSNTTNDANDEFEGDEIPKQQAPHNSKSNTCVPKPTQLGYYSSKCTWQNILQAAKNEYRCHIHLVHAFHECNSKTLSVAGDFLLDVIIKYQDNEGNAPLDNSKYLFLCIDLYS